MATFTYVDPKTGFTYSYDENEGTQKDEIRGLIGDTNGIPMWFLTDGSILRTISKVGANYWQAVAQCADKAAAICLSLHRRVQQGHRLTVENFDPMRMRQEFLAMADEYRDRQQPAPGEPTNPGALTTHMRHEHYDPSGVDRRGIEFGFTEGF